MTKILLSIAVLMFVAKHGIAIPSLKNKISMAVSTCLIQILNTYFSRSQKLSINYTNDSRFLVDEILQRVHIPAIVNALEYRMEIEIDNQMSTDVIIVLDEMTDVRFVLNTTVWYGDSVFLVVSNSVSKLKDIFQIFWENKIVNVYVLNENGGTNITVYSFVPYGPTDCGVGNPVIVDKWKDNEFETGNIAQITDKEKLKNMNGCPINISAVDAKPFTIFEQNRSQNINGIEGKIMLEISKILNFTAWFGEPRDGQAWGWAKPKPAGGVGEVYTGQSEFVMGMLAPLFRRYLSMDLSIPYSPMECITLAVPRGMRGKQDVWIRFLLSEFSNVVWLCLCLSVLTTISIYFILVKFRRNMISNHSSSIMSIISTIIGVQTRHSLFTELNVLYLLWAYVSLILTSAYQSSLSSKLSVPTAAKDIETFEQLLESNLELWGWKSHHAMLSGNINETSFKNILDRYIVMNKSIESGLEIMITKRNIAYTHSRSTFLYESLRDEKSRGAVYVLKDCIFVYYLTIMMKKYSPYTNRVNKTIYRLLSGGVIKHWLSNYLYDVPKNSNPVMKLSLEKLKGIFFFWTGGLILSGLAFIGELVHHKYFN